jgi:hypothetical protein
MNYEGRFTDSDLGNVIELGVICMCACPAQVAQSMRNLRELYRYQLHCMENPRNEIAVHAHSAQSTIHAHSVMQDCLDKVIEMEGWGRSTLQMPSGLRARQRQVMLSDTEDDPVVEIRELPVPKRLLAQTAVGSRW